MKLIVEEDDCINLALLKVSNVSNKYSKKNGDKPSNIILLYPQTKDMKDRDDIMFTSEDGVVVNVFFVDLASIEDSLKRLLNYLS